MMGYRSGIRSPILPVENVVQNKHFSGPWSLHIIILGSEIVQDPVSSLQRPSGPQIVPLIHCDILGQSLLPKKGKGSYLSY